ncbi:MAG: hypothetical protein IJ640_09180 [Prevotella sp.]|nr:hypothetical protein [Prevotella sp.]
MNEADEAPLFLCLHVKRLTALRLSRWGATDINMTYHSRVSLIGLVVMFVVVTATLAFEYIRAANSDSFIFGKYNETLHIDCVQEKLNFHVTIQRIKRTGKIQSATASWGNDISGFSGPVNMRVLSLTERELRLSEEGSDYVVSVPLHGNQASITSSGKIEKLQICEVQQIDGVFYHCYFNE